MQIGRFKDFQGLGLGAVQEQTTHEQLPESENKEIYMTCREPDSGYAGEMRRSPRWESLDRIYALLARRRLQCRLETWRRG